MSKRKKNKFSKEENNLDNGKVTLAYEYITKKYKECMGNNSFYIGK